VSCGAVREILTISRLYLFLFAGVLACLVNASGAVSAQQPTTAPGAARKPAPANQKFVAQSPAVPAAQLPNGASSISEIYGDWTVNCRLLEGQKQCLLLQAQGDTQTKQRIFEIQLRTPKDGKTEGTILMPFGLKLDAGAILSLDDKDLGQGLRFSTCMPQGCLLPVSLQTVTTEAMKKGKTITVASLNLNNGEVVAFKISLDGYAAASARIAELAR
jgi:invasion protein IalB